MKLAIHKSSRGFHPKWVAYCKEENIPYKLVNCYDSNIIKELEDCDALLWHHHHFNPKDILFAKQLLFSLEMTGKVVFPDFNTGWHFDDKVGQKYLMETLYLPIVPSYVFYDKKEAIEWAINATYPKVWKLRGGAGGSNVRLVKNEKQALKLINVAFKSGFNQYNALKSLKERWRQFRNKKADFLKVIKGVGRLFYTPFYNKVMGREIGYIYFQDFIINNDSDTRVIIINNKAFGLKRMVRKGDFRASGSGEFYNRKEDIDERCIRIAFEATEKIKSKSAVFDFVFDKENKPLIIEISYGFSITAYDSCPGYWDRTMQWHEGKFNPQAWMIDGVIEELEKRKISD